jgi:hypothetical protein
MAFRRRWIAGTLATLLLSLTAPAQTGSASTSPAPQVKTPASSTNSSLDNGTVTNGVYRNKTLVFSCKIPEGWVLRTDEMNARDEKEGTEKEGREKEGSEKVTQDNAVPQPAASSAGAKVLLAAFSRPPDARAEDVNASILIAAESVASYPGLKEAAQYFGPLIEVAKAQGFTLDENPYDIAIGSKTLVRGDFRKNVGTRVMRQSTLAMLSHGYAISITVIGGTDDEVEDLVDGLTFTAPGK